MKYHFLFSGGCGKVIAMNRKKESLKESLNRLPLYRQLEEKSDANFSPERIPATV